MIGQKADVIKWLLDQPDGMYEATTYRQRRTLTQNAYFHALVHEIARRVRLSDIETKNRLISEYGVIDEDVRTIIADDAINWEKSPYLHLRPTTATRIMDNGRLYRVFYVMAGTHTLNTADMAHLLDGTIEEAEQLGIATLPTAIIQDMRAREYRRDKVNRSIG